MEISVVIRKLDNFESSVVVCNITYLSATIFNRMDDVS